MKLLIGSALLAALLGGCAVQGGKPAPAPYLPAAQTCLSATKEWLSQPQDKARLSKALANCDSTLAGGKGQAEVEKRRSYNDLQQLQMSLSTARSIMDQGGDPRKVDTTTGIVPVESVKIVLALLETDLQNEVRTPTPAPQ